MIYLSRNGARDKHTSGSSYFSSLGSPARRAGLGGGGGRGEGSCGGLDAALITVLVCEVIGGGAIALHAVGLAVSNWVDGVGDFAALGAAVVVIIVACDLN